MIKWKGESPESVAYGLTVIEIIFPKLRKIFLFILRVRI